MLVGVLKRLLDDKDGGVGRANGDELFDVPGRWRCTFSSTPKLRENAVGLFNGGIWTPGRVTAI